MSRSNPPFYTGPDLGLPDADDFLHNPSGASSAIQVPGEESELANTDSKVMHIYLLVIDTYIMLSKGNFSTRLESPL